MWVAISVLINYVSSEFPMCLLLSMVVKRASGLHVVRLVFTFYFFFVWKCVLDGVADVIQVSQWFLICKKDLIFLQRCAFSYFHMHLMFYVVHHFDVCLILVWITMKHCLLFFDPMKGYEMFISIVLYKIWVVWV